MGYSANDIETLSAGRAFREKLGMYLTGEKQEAINLGLRELIVNAQDEYEVYKPEGAYCKIDLNTVTKEITVSDNLRGIPVGIRTDGVNSLTAAFLIPHSGGKHREGAYSSAVGVNGEGNKIVCHTAKWLEVEVHRDNKIYTQRFESDEEGARAVTEVITKPGDATTGTRITYVADPKVYGDIFIDIESLRKMLSNMSLFSRGLRFVLTIDGKEEILYSERGLIDGLSNTNTISKPLSYYYETEDCKVELALQWVSKGGKIKGYANSLYVPDGGRFISSFKSSLTRTFNSLSKSNFSGEQIRNLLDGFVSVKVKVGQWSNQAKTSLANPEAGTATSTAISNCLKEFYVGRKEEFEKVVELLNKLEKAEKAAERARIAVLEHNKEMTQIRKNKLEYFRKLHDAEELGDGSTLFVSEGSSAAQALLSGRRTKYEGVMEIKGKMLNTFKAQEDRIMKNEEIKLFLYALGQNIYDFNKRSLRYGRVAIASDQDADGFAIALLIMVVLHTICPEFLKENRLYRLYSPLYIEHDKSGNPVKWWYSDDDYNADRDKIKGEVARIKGWGSLTDIDLSTTIFSSQGRLDKIIYSEEGIKTLEDLMGIDVAPRKEYVFNNIDFSKYGEII